MDNDGSSSIYTTESHTPSINHEHRPSIDTTTSSIRPGSSFGLRSPPSPAGSHRHRISYTPSYMSFQNGHTPASTKPICIPRSPLQPITTQPPTTSQGLLLITIAGAPDPSTIASLRALVKKHSFSGVVIIGSSEHGVEIKKLKMDVFALIGKLGLELSVQIHLQDTWGESEIVASVQEALGSVHHIGSVMCYPSYNYPRTAAKEILNLERSELERSWMDGLGFLHAVAKATIPQLQKQDSERSSVFLLMTSAANTAAALISKNACEMLIGQLGTAESSSKLVVGSSETLLLPDPELLQADEPPSSVLEPAAQLDADTYTFKTGESPTKLWNMWALQEQLEKAE